MMPVFVRKLNFLNYPINKELFGENKTVRGFFSAIFIAILVIYIQWYLYKFDAIKKISLINYYEINLLFVGFLSGFGAITGDLIKSYFKRRRKIKPGHSWMPFDQIDFMLGSLLFLYPLFNLKLNNVFVLLVITPFLHILVNHVGYYLKIREIKW